MKCLNCGNEATDNYCAHCGQPTSTGKITFSSILTGLLSSVTDVERGLLYNIKNLTIAPRKTIIGYLEGKRVSLYPPLSYAAIMIASLVLLDINFADTPLDINPGSFEDQEEYKLGERYGKFLRSNLRYIWFLNIFFFALPCALFFQRFKLAEHIIINAFIFGHAAFFSILLFPLFPWSVIVNPIVYASILLLYFLVFHQAKDWLDRFIFIPIILILGLLLFILIPLMVYIAYDWFF